MQQKEVDRLIHKVYNLQSTPRSFAIVFIGHAILRIPRNLGNQSVNNSKKSDIIESQTSRDWSILTI